MRRLPEYMIFSCSFHWSLTFLSGQQPHSPVNSLQQVVCSGHWFAPSHWTEEGSASSLVMAGILVYHGITTSPFMHDVRLLSHLYCLGQQWLPSSQHTAWREVKAWAVAFTSSILLFHFFFHWCIYKGYRESEEDAEILFYKFKGTSIYKWLL